MKSGRDWPVKASIRLSQGGLVATNPAVVNLLGNTTYIVEFQYRILGRGTNATVLDFGMLPAGTTDATLGVSVPSLLKNAAANGTFSVGAQTADAGSYVFSIRATAQSDVIVDNISIFRKDTVQTDAAPPAWSNLMTLPFPRLGNNQQSTAVKLSQLAPGEGMPYYYTVDQIENRLAFSDVVTGMDLSNQTVDPASLRRLRQLNPNIVLAPYRDAEEQGPWLATPPSNKSIIPDYQFSQQIADPWYARDSHGNYVVQPQWGTRLMNLSDYCPVVNGQTFLSSLVAWLDRGVFPSGQWDGIFLDVLLAEIQPYMAYSNDPAVWDFDWNHNGFRDETKAQTSDMVRNGAKGLLANLRSQVGDRELIQGNAGPIPELSLAPYVNGYLFECFNGNWDVSWLPTPSQAGWRNLWDAYRAMQAATRLPRMNILEGCGKVEGNQASNPTHLAPTAKDLQAHRMGLATALLSDGFYEYDLFDARSAPYWFDEYSVNENGAAVEDRAKKGYLGQALAGAVELAPPGTLVFQEGFESGVIPASFSYDTAHVFVTQAPEKVIAGKASLVISNPDHSQMNSFTVSLSSNSVPLASAKTYLVSVDWRILSTVDTSLSAGVLANGQSVDGYRIPGTVTGDSGTSQFPLTTPASGNWLIFWTLTGGGEVALDNVRIYDGGVGPWRRDFENGFVLVNPLLQPHTFSANELAGTLKRTAIHRINGTQAPNVNNGQPVSGGFTLGPFDAIVLLAGHLDAQAGMSASKPSIKPGGVISAANFGTLPSISPGSWIEIYGANLSATARGWSATDFTGPNAPTSLDGVKVTIGERAAFLDYVSPGQVNALVPSDVPVGPAQLVVSGPAGTSDPYIVAVETVQPGLLAPPSFQVGGKQYIAALALDGRTFMLPAGAIPGVPSRPAKPGDTILLYGIGFGSVTPNLNAGTLVSRQNSLSNPIEIRFGNTPAALGYYGLAPNATGLYQFNVVVPDVPDNPAVPLTFSLAGTIPSQTLYIAVQH